MESGNHPYTLEELLDKEEVEGLLSLRLGYGQTNNSSELMTKLREEKSVFIVAGDLFGMDHYLRIGIGSEKDYLMAGLGLFDEVLNDMS